MKAVNSIALGSLLLLTASGCASTPRSEALGGWTPLFDGRSLAGWTPKIVGEAAGEDSRQTFTVRDGTIRVSYSGYNRFAGRFGHLFFDRPLRFFRLRLRYRFLDPGLADAPAWARSNSGVMFLAEAPQEMGRDQPFPVSIELQLLGRDGSAPRPTGSVCTPGTDIEIEGSRAPEHCTSSKGPTIANRTWVRLELDVLPSGEIIHRIDGKVVQQYAKPTLDPTDPLATIALERAHGRLAVIEGHLALQSEGHPVEFADIELMRLE